MKYAYLYKTHKVGDYINLDGCVWRIVWEGDSDIDCLIGSKGILKYGLEWVRDGYITLSEVDSLKAADRSNK